jgi:hypothetical protein
MRRGDRRDVGQIAVSLSDGLSDRSVWLQYHLLAFPYSKGVFAMR